MPLWLRKFTFKKLDDWYEEQSKSNKSSKNTNIDLANPDKSKKPPKENISPPSYVETKLKKLIFLIFIIKH